MYHVTLTIEHLNELTKLARQHGDGWQMQLTEPAECQLRITMTNGIGERVYEMDLDDGPGSRTSPVPHVPTAADRERAELDGQSSYQSAVYRSMRRSGYTHDEALREARASS